MREKYKLNADGDVVHATTGALFSERAVKPVGAEKGSVMTKQPVDPIAVLADFLAREAAHGASARTAMRALTDKQRRTLNKNGGDGRIKAALRYFERGA
ncbi:MAG: hypothetical protein IPM18_12090 [Phycisphaerales bacterium]|nr:hypothetical protein [Phycisphaerales bacterium]